jgi:hypothetical protein
MKNSFLIIIAMALTSVLVIQGCDRNSTQQERETSVIETERDIDIARSELQAEIRIYRLEAENEFKENNQNIADIKLEIEKKESNTRAAHLVRVVELERTNQNMKRQLDNYNYTTQVHWNAFKKDFSSAMNDLESSLNSFFSTTTATSNN